jgi:hypothetical protein
MAETLTDAQSGALAQLRDIVKPGDTIYTILRSVSASRMTRRISCYAIVNGVPIWLDGYIDTLGIYKMNRKASGPQGLRVTGCGMDMGFAVVDALDYALFGASRLRPQLQHRWL